MKKIYQTKGIKMKHKTLISNFYLIGDKLIENYSSKDFTEIIFEISPWISLTKQQSILRMKGKFTIEHTEFIYWN